MSVSAKQKTRTMRPSSPCVADHVAPPSRLMTAPPPRVPATTTPLVYGLKLTVVMADFAPCTIFHASPPLVLRSSEPWESPATTTWLFEGSTASANNATRGWLGSDAIATHVESESAPAKLPELAIATTHSATIVARRRWPSSDTNERIITQPALGPTVTGDR